MSVQNSASKDRPPNITPVKEPPYYESAYQNEEGFTNKAKFYQTAQKENKTVFEDRQPPNSLSKTQPFKSAAESQDPNPDRFLAEFENTLFEERKNQAKIKDNLTAQVSSYQIRLCHLKEELEEATAIVSNLEAQKTELKTAFAEASFKYKSAKELSFIENNLMNCQMSFEDGQFREQCKAAMESNQLREKSVNDQIMEIRRQRNEEIGNLKSEIERLERVSFELQTKLEDAQTQAEMKNIESPELTLIVQQNLLLEKARFEFLTHEVKRLLQARTDRLLRLEQTINEQASFFGAKEAEIENEIAHLDHDRIAAQLRVKELGDLILILKQSTEVQNGEISAMESRLKLIQSQNESSEIQIEKTTVNNVLDIEEAELRAEGELHDKESEVLEADKTICELEAKLLAIKNEKMDTIARRKTLFVDLKSQIVQEISKLLIFD